MARSLVAFRWRLRPRPRPPLELADDLGPNRDRAHKQRDRRQRGGLFHENPQHRRLPLVL